MAGRAAAGAIASYMEDANEAAETETKEQEAAKPCVDCGEIDCFNPPEGSTPDQINEFRRQLKEQQDTINGMDPGQLVQNIDRFAKYGRPDGDAAGRKLTRDTYRTQRTRELERQYLKEGKNNFRELAASDVAKEMANLAATHTLDLVAGGDGSISGMGNKTINSSLGAQWKGRRAAQLRQHAENAAKQGKKMNVTLEECAQNGGKSSSQDGGSNSPGDSGPGNGNPSDVPMS
ncbi:polymorphic toxin type 15 domain-containing protein (plasmid) [Rhizobium sophoriradicis]|uniref:polymorphic toxin type 15 domain-containing protein n=1 Tax=Rhizobium sophoriradicis TaxID=1535245 RepID=UPI0017C2841F|nr:polymorphic toxin type 15 domain-containing protein [Rhizobium leguminosarum bv. phaseoli]